jgi:membrane protein
MSQVPGSPGPAPARTAQVGPDPSKPRLGRHRGRAKELKLITALDDHRRKDAGVSASEKTASDSAAGWPGVRRAGRAAQWGKKKYAGSLAEDVWRRLEAIEFINRSMVFAATLLLCFFPFLIVASALAGRPEVKSLTRYTGLNSQAAADIGHLFASSAATTSAVVGTASMVFFVFGGIAAAAALQEIYERSFDLPHRRMKGLPHRLAWLAVLIGTSLLTGWAGPWLRHAGGPALLAVAGLIWCTGFWWLTMRILLGGRISWRAVFPAACATGVLYVAMEAVFSLFFSGMVISDEKRYGPIGIIFALLSYLIAIGVVVILGAVVGRAWHERSSVQGEGGLARRSMTHRGDACPRTR